MFYLNIFIILFLCQALPSARDNKTLQKPTDFDAHFSLVNLTVSDGLYENNINDVLQDGYGFLWLA